MSRLALLPASVLLLAAMPFAALAQEGEGDYPADELIHSDLPLFTEYEEGRVWPQPFRDPSEPLTFGCVSRVSLGDWRLESASEDEPGGWFRFTNYGVFHCYTIISEAYERDELDVARWDYGFFVELGERRSRGARSSSGRSGSAHDQVAITCSSHVRPEGTALSAASTCSSAIARVAMSAMPGRSTLLPHAIAPSTPEASSLRSLGEWRG